jgi:hypothetical protein
VTEHLDVPEGIVRRVRLACAHLPEAYEEAAYAGVRWRIRGRTLVHVLTRTNDQAVPVTFMTFHASGEELDALPAMGDPFFPGWGAGLVAMVLREDGTDWDEVKELLTDSYCLLAPKKLIARLEDRQPRP